MVKFQLSYLQADTSGTVNQGFSNFWCYGAREEIDHYLRSPAINF